MWPNPSFVKHNKELFTVEKGGPNYGLLLKTAQSEQY
jgi:hypothetical protein